MLIDNFEAPLILVVEDDDDHAGLIQRSFKEDHNEYRIEIVGTLLDARQVIERLVPDLVLTDFRLPDGDGNELVTMVNGACPVILMTSQGNEQMAVTIIKAGAQDYIVKSPDAFSAMPRIVKMALREWNLIQERIKTHQDVIRAKREWELTFDAVPDLISIIDTNHTISRVNRAMADRCGLEPEELTGRKCYEVFHGMSSLPGFCPCARMIQDGNLHTEEVEEKKTACFFEITVSPLYDNDGSITACVHIARDITERKKNEKDRLSLEQQYQQTQKLESLGVLAGGVAHDFNNILTIILGHCFLAKENIDSGLTNRCHLQEIEDAANRASALCRQMLTYAGKSPLIQTQINLWLLVDETIKMLKSAIKKNVSFELDLKCTEPVITGDKSQIQQIVMNLVINAAEAIDNDNGTVSVDLRKIDVQAGQTDKDFLGNNIPAGKYACLEVSDTGCGMDEKTKKRLFEPFFTTKFTGRGLGMSTILGIIKSHAGALQLSSTPGAGTTFSIYLPLTDKPDYAETTQTTGEVFFAKPGGTILLVDDEPELRAIGATMITALGFFVITASNGREALEIYREKESIIDLIFTDLIMPEMGGVETYKELRKLAPSIPIIFCSGYDRDEISALINNDERAGFVQKPYRPDHLSNVLTKYMDTTG